MLSSSSIARRWLLAKAGDHRKPLVFLDTETTGLNPDKEEILSLSMIDEAGKPILKHPRSGKPVKEIRFTPQHLEHATPWALQVNGYPAWQRYLAQEVEGPDGKKAPRGKLYANWKKDKDQLHGIMKDWSDFALHPSEEEKQARSSDDWSDSVPYADMADQISDVISTHKIAGHNPAFDRLFIEADLAKAGKPTKSDPEMVDTMALSYMAGIPSQKLDFTADAVGINLQHAHTAYDDTEASRQVYHALRDPKRVQQARQKMTEEHGGPNRGVMFFGMNRTGDSVKDDKITHLTVADQHGRIVFDHGLSEDPGTDTDTMNYEDASKEVSDLLRDNMLGGHNPGLDSAFIRKMLKDHNQGMYSPVLDTASLQHAYDIESKDPGGDDPRERALDEARVFAEAGHKMMGDQAPHKNVAHDFETWAQGRSFRHPLRKGDPRRKRDFISFRHLKDMADHGLSDASEPAATGKPSAGPDQAKQSLPDAREAAQRDLDAALRWFEAWQERVKKHAKPAGEKVATAWIARFASRLKPPSAFLEKATQYIQDRVSEHMVRQLRDDSRWEQADLLEKWEQQARQVRTKPGQVRKKEEDPNGLPDRWKTSIRIPLSSIPGLDDKTLERLKRDTTAFYEREIEKLRGAVEKAPQGYRSREAKRKLHRLELELQEKQKGLKRKSLTVDVQLGGRPPSGSPLGQFGNLYGFEKRLTLYVAVPNMGDPDKVLSTVRDTVLHEAQHASQILPSMLMGRAADTWDFGGAGGPKPKREPKLSPSAPVGDDYYLRSAEFYPHLEEAETKLHDVATGLPKPLQDLALKILTGQTEPPQERGYGATRALDKWWEDQGDPKGQLRERGVLPLDSLQTWKRRDEKKWRKAVKELSKSLEESRASPEEHPLWKEFWDSVYEAGARKVINPNRRTRQSHPKIRADYRYRTDRFFQQEVQREFAEWKEQQAKAKTKGPKEEKGKPLPPVHKPIRRRRKEAVKVATAWLRSQLIAPVHDNLRQNIWDGDKLRPEVRKKLLEIAARFKTFLGIPLSVKDIYFMGSLANYNYTNESDIDLHLLVDFEEIDGEDLLRELFTAKKSLFNDEHDIFIGPAEVELYVQDVDEPNASTGVYSVRDDKWIQHPKHVKPDIDKKAIMTKAHDLMGQIDTLIKHDASSGHYDRLKDKIKKMRTSGLQRGGEFSTENLAFKVLRRNGYLEKLGDAATKAFDRELSLS